MELIKAIMFDKEPEVQSSKKPAIDFTKKIKINVAEDVVIDEEAPKRGRPRKVKSEDNMVDTGMELPKVQTNEPYTNTYSETTNLLKNAVFQVDVLANDIKIELDNIKSSKTLKNKYSYITDLTGTISNLMSTKISAIREMNNTITNCHNLEIKRIKEINQGVTQDNDDKKIMDLYNAFISTPVGVIPTQLGPSRSELAFTQQQGPIVRSGEDQGYVDFINNASPEQNRMMSQFNPNIKTVVVFDINTGRKHFDVIDTTTGQSVPNIARPAEFLLDETRPNVKIGKAKNNNTNMEWDLIVIGENNNYLNF